MAKSRRSALTAEQIADHALAQSLGSGSTPSLVNSSADADGDAPSLSEAIAALQTHAQEARRTYNGRELMLFEAEPEKVGRLVDYLVQGLYRETAATLAGVTSRSVRGWMERAEAGDVRCQPFATVVKIAEALAEASAVKAVRAAGKLPQFWAAEMTYLERRHPDRWGRRQEAADGPRVIVMIGAKPDMIERLAVVATPILPAPVEPEAT